MNAIIARLDRIEQHVKAIALMRSVEDYAMGQDKAAEYLGITEDFLYRLTSQKKITHYKSGRKNVFYKSDLDTYLAKGRVESIEELADRREEERREEELK